MAHRVLLPRTALLLFIGIFHASCGARTERTDLEKWGTEHFTDAFCVEIPSSALVSTAGDTLFLMLHRNRAPLREDVYRFSVTIRLMSAATFEESVAMAATGDQDAESQMMFGIQKETRVWNLEGSKYARRDVECRDGRFLRAEGTMAIATHSASQKRDAVQDEAAMRRIMNSLRCAGDKDCT